MEIVDKLPQKIELFSKIDVDGIIFYVTQFRVCYDGTCDICACRYKDLDEIAKQEVRLKYPNDLYVNICDNIYDVESL